MSSLIERFRGKFNRRNFFIGAGITAAASAAAATTAAFGPKAYELLTYQPPEQMPPIHPESWKTAIELTYFTGQPFSVTQVFDTRNTRPAYFHIPSLSECVTDIIYTHDPGVFSIMNARLKQYIQQPTENPIRRPSTTVPAILFNRQLDIANDHNLTELIKDNEYINPLQFLPILYIPQKFAAGESVLYTERNTQAEFSPFTMKPDVITAITYHKTTVLTVNNSNPVYYGYYVTPSRSVSIETYPQMINPLLRTGLKPEQLGFGPTLGK